MSVKAIMSMIALACLIPSSVQNIACAEENGQVAILTSLAQAVDASEKLTPKAKMIVKDVLMKECSNPIFVKEVKAQNAKGVSLDAIKAIDAEWTQKEGDVPLQEELLANIVANEFMNIAGDGVVIEGFVMDNQGALVGANNNTSDYWQGDEAKFTGAFNGGQGGVEIGDAEVDASTGMGQQKVSLPIIAEDGSVIGAICFGLDVTKINA